MKCKSLLRTCAFLLVVVLLLVLVSRLLVTRQVRGGVYNEPLNTLDYLAMGDSECLASLSPMELWRSYGYAGFNCGVPAQRMQDAYYTLLNVLDYQTPKILLLETNLFFRDLGYIHEAKSFIKSLAYQAFPITEFHSLWKNWFFPKLNEQADPPGTTYKGVHCNKQVVPCDPNHPAKISEYGSEILPLQRFYLNKLTALCREKGIQLILFAVPSPVNWSQAKHDTVVQYAEENDLPFFDLNETADEAGIDWATDTYDGGDHVNFYGMQKVTACIGRYLSENCTLPDRRENTWYAYWNDELESYLAFTGQS